MVRTQNDVDSLREERDFLRRELLAALRDLSEVVDDLLRERRRAETAEGELARVRRMIRPRWRPRRAPWWRGWFGL